MSISGVSFNLSSVCQARGGIEINRPEGIDQEKQNEIKKLNDLAGLLKMKETLTQLDIALSAIERFSTSTAIKLSQALASASGQTAFEKYLKALESICGDDRCSSLPQADRPRATARLNLLRNASTQLAEIQISNEALVRLVEIESQSEEVGVKKTLAAVKLYIEQLAADLHLTSNQLAEGVINSLIANRCQAGVYVAQVISPPIEAPPTTPVVQTPVERPSLISYDLELTPVWGVLLSGENNPSVEAGPSLHVHGGLGLNLSGKLRLQIDYAGFKNASDDFSYSRIGQDLVAVSVAGRISKIMEIIGQISYLWKSNDLSGENEHLGAAGVGVSFWDGLLYPFAGGIFGTEFGGYGGISSTYEWDFKKSSLGISGEVLYSYADSQQIGGLVKGFWRTPVNLLGSRLTVGVGVGSNYDFSEKAANLIFGIFFGFCGRNLPPQPISFGGF